MDVFIVMEFNICDDPYYGYKEKNLSGSASFDEAKGMLDAYISENNGEDSDEDGAEWQRNSSGRYVQQRPLLQWQVKSTAQHGIA